MHIPCLIIVCSLTLAAHAVSQERLTMQIGHELQEILETEDVAVVITAEHLCVSSRGIQDVNSETVSAFFGGKFENETTRQEFNNYLTL